MALGTAAGRQILQDYIVDQDHGAVTFGAHTGAPGATGTANEVTGGSYGRVAAPSWALHSTAKSVSLSSACDIAGMPAVGGSGVTHLSVWVGSVYFCDIDCNDQVVLVGNTLRINAGVTITA